jgi:KUP system potassium uptake protein
MLITTVAIGLVAARCWRRPWWLAVLFVGALFAIESLFLVSSLTKLAQGAYFPVLIAGALLTVMLTWHRGRAIIAEHVRAKSCSIEKLLERLPMDRALPGQLVLITMNRNPAHAIARLQEMVRQGIALREQIIILSLLNAMKSNVDIAKSIEVKRSGPRLWHVLAEHGYMQEPHAPEILDRAVMIGEAGLPPRSDSTFFVLPRELIIEYRGSRFARWRRVLFGVLNRNQSYAPDYFYIPHTQLIEFTWMMEA